MARTVVLHAPIMQLMILPYFTCKDKTLFRKEEGGGVTLSPGEEKNEAILSK